MSAVFKTQLDEVADVIAHVIAKCDPEDAMSIAIAMDEYEDQRPRTMADLKRIPGFRKLWDAIERAAMERSDKVFESEVA